MLWCRAWWNLRDLKTGSQSLNSICTGESGYEHWLNDSRTCGTSTACVPPIPCLYTLIQYGFVLGGRGDIIPNGAARFCREGPQGIPISYLTTSLVHERWNVFKSQAKTDQAETDAPLGFPRGDKVLPLQSQLHHRTIYVAQGVGCFDSCRTTLHIRDILANNRNHVLISCQRLSRFLV